MTDETRQSPTQTVSRGQWRVVPHPKLKRDFVGRTVRTRRFMSNAMVAIPKGTIAVVKWRPRTGAELTTEPCQCCGLSAKISKVQDCDIEFVEQLNTSRRPAAPDHAAQQEK